MRRGRVFRKQGIDSHVIDVSHRCMHPVIENGRAGSIRFNTGIGGVRVSNVSFVRRLSFGTFGRNVHLGSYVHVRRGLVGMEMEYITTSSVCTGGTGEGFYAGCKVSASFIHGKETTGSRPLEGILEDRLSGRETAQLRKDFNARGRRCSLSEVGTEGEGARVL